MLYFSGALTALTAAVKVDRATAAIVAVVKKLDAMNVRSRCRGTLKRSQFCGTVTYNC